MACCRWTAIRLIELLSACSNRHNDRIVFSGEADELTIICRCHYNFSISLLLQHAAKHIPRDSHFGVRQFQGNLVASHLHVVSQVLHMDRNNYYGGESASLNLNQVRQPGCDCSSAAAKSAANRDEWVLSGSV